MGRDLAEANHSMNFYRLALLLTYSLLFQVNPASADEPKPAALLWQNAAAQSGQAPLPPKKPWVIREREIAFDPQVLTTVKDAAARPHPPLAIELFDGKTYDLDITSTVSRLSDLSTVKGTFKQTARTTWSIVINGTLVNGTFQIGDRLYKVEHVQNGRHRLLEVDPTKLPAE